MNNSTIKSIDGPYCREAIYATLAIDTPKFSSEENAILIFALIHLGPSKPLDILYKIFDTTRPLTTREEAAAVKTMIQSFIKPLISARIVTKSNDLYYLSDKFLKAYNTYYEGFIAFEKAGIIMLAKEMHWYVS